MFELLLDPGFAAALDDDIVARTLAAIDEKRVYEEELWRGLEAMSAIVNGGDAGFVGYVTEPRQVGTLVVCATCGQGGGTLVNAAGDKTRKVHRRCL